MSVDVDPLKKLGLRDSDVAVYLDLLRHGTSTASQIAKRTGMNRSHTYEKIEALLDKGFVSRVVRNETQHFDACPPERLLDYLEGISEDISRIIPGLNRIHPSAPSKTIVEFYEGVAGVKLVFKDILRDKNDYCALGEEGKFQELFPVFIQQFLRDVALAGITEHIISKESKRNAIRVTKRTKIRYLPDKYFSPAMIAVYGDKIAIWIWSEPVVAILIRNADIAKSFKTYFDILWHVAKD